MADDDGDKGDKGAVLDEAATAALTKSVTGAVIESLGLKSGQTLQAMVNTTAQQATLDAIGIKEGQDAKEYFSGIIKDAVSGSDDADADANAGTGDDDAPKGDSALRTEFQEIKAQTKSLIEDRDKAVRDATNSRRSGAIRDLLDTFDMRKEMKSMVTKSFENGLDGPALDMDDEGNLTVKDDNGAPRDAKAYLDDYFKTNAWMLNSMRKKGSGPGKGTTKPADAPALATDQKTGRLLTGLALVDSYAKLAESDADGALEALQKSNRERAAALGMPY